jgi:tetratricopeptide (TPR) repeat protein
VLDLSALKTGHMAVGVVADNEVKRRQILDAMRLMHLRDIRDFRSFFDLSIAIEKSEVQWVFCTFCDEEGENLGAYLEHQVGPEAAAKVAFSVLLKEGDYGQLPHLFDFGLMSWHENADAPDEIAELVYRLQRSLDDSALPAMVAFQYLQKFYRQQERWGELVSVCERLLRLYPHEDRLRLTLIEALYEEGEEARAKAILLSMEYFDPNLAAPIASLRQRLLQEGDSQHKLMALQYQMRSAILVDPDPESTSLVEAKLRELGFREITHFKRGDQAAQYISHNSFDLAVIEWQCEGLAGPFLIQRIRELGYIEVPILVMTEVLDRADTQLVKDMGVAQVLKRPIRMQQFTMAAAWAMTQAREPTEASSLERKLLGALGVGDLEKAKLALRQFQGIESRDPIREKFLKASILYHEKRYFEAKILLIEATHSSGGDNVNLAALLAKCLIKLGDYQAALMLLQKVTALSPKNIERLCTLSEVSVQTKNQEAAEETLEVAESLDPNSPRVQQTQVKVAVTSGQTQKAMEILKHLSNVEEVVAYMNNLAVSFSKTGDLAEGVRLYKNCLKIIPDDRTTLQAVVAYNLGLAMVKNEDTQLGSIYLKQSLDKGPSPVYQRAESLYRRILDARRLGVSVRLYLGSSQDRNDSVEQSIDDVSFLNELEAERSNAYFLRGLVLPKMATHPDFRLSS